MNIYPTVGAVVSMSQTGNGNVAGAVVNINYNGQNYACSLNVEGSTSSTKNGTKRVMIKATIIQPVFAYQAGDVGYTAVQNGAAPFTLHCVLTVPGTAAVNLTNTQLLSGSQDAIKCLVGCLCATMCGDVSAKNATSVGLTSPLWRGLRDFFPLDITSGTYGAAS